MTKFRSATLYLAILGAGALFGFYFTMSVSIMPGFDLTDPYAALQANQDIGRATQQSAFFVALLGTPVLLIVALFAGWERVSSRNWLLVSLAGWIAMMVVTFLCNVPLNQMLDGMTISPTASGLDGTWQTYSVPWQFWNWFRVASSGVTLLAAVIALKEIGGMRTA